ncbi:Oidioi.mRNA.OKI2018_I69.chr2.g4514.t1.cds [Oikopleura dioica]|uniref:Oidioi.mRNA.OKI2018_I69.chr2.g4514.t1.cds n=1 Tax=Oikopleura dioica TaxID=34765 RepID=A0ABN7T1V7_OIKDI|nr:Oidioi.mRNA.OKI2018_I69.chr2.g4514.t1.cds [Oikopleura dioica]
MNRIIRISILVPLFIILFIIWRRKHDEIRDQYKEEIDVKFQYEENDLIKDEFRVFNPGIKYINGSVLTVLRVNWLFKDSNPNFKNGRSEWRKNNSLILAQLDRNGLVTKLVPFQPFEDSYDCEMDPDWIDGGHGLQDPRIISQKNTLKILFNARNQNKEPFQPCFGDIKRGLWMAELSKNLEIMNAARKLSEISLGKWDIERNWTPIDDENAEEEIFIYSFYPELIVVNTTASEVDFKIFPTVGKFEDTFRSVAEIAKIDAEEANKKISLHGSSPLIRLNNEEFLGILHCHFAPENDDSRVYINYFFKMRISTDYESFQITSSGFKPLPLVYEIDEKFEKLNQEKKQYRDNYLSKNKIVFVSDMTRFERLFPKKRKITPDEMERRNEAKNRLENARVFQRNVDETTIASRFAIDSNIRKKHNDSDINYQTTPTTLDFKNFILSYSETLQHQSQNMKVIGKLLKEDHFYESGDRKRAEQKNIVQNMFDGFRYTNPLLKNLGTLKIPISEGNNFLQTE